MATGERDVDWLESNVLADMVVLGEITREDAEGRLFQYWETRLSREQCRERIGMSVAAAEQFRARFGDPR